MWPVLIVCVSVALMLCSLYRIYRWCVCMDPGGRALARLHYWVSLQCESEGEEVNPDRIAAFKEVLARMDYLMEHSED